MIKQAIRQPITVAVVVLLSVFAGTLAITRVPIRMTPEVQSVIISAVTFWESASAADVESDIVEEQEKVLGQVTGLKAITSSSIAGQGSVRLEFETGIDIDDALADVLQKLDEVPGYPNGVLQPVVEPVDPDSVDYIAWVGLSSTDPDFDATTLYDFMERQMQPRFDRVKGISQVGIRGARQSELRIFVDPAAMADRKITYTGLRQAIQAANVDISAGRIQEGKRDVRVRMVGRFQSPEDLAEMVLRRDADGTIRLGDIATIEETYKDKRDWARARGIPMPFFNFQLQRGANLLETMALLEQQIDKMNLPDGLLEQHARRLGINGTFELVKVYDSTTYVHDALTLVKSNLLLGSILATLTLLLFLRSLRSVGIIAIAIPVSVIASFVVLVALGRSINIISLAGLAFAVGMVVDNAIVVIENIYRHIELKKAPMQAALDGTREVAGAVIASTCTTLVVFLPILLVKETAGQLFRDIALAIMAAVGLSMLVSLAVIPTMASRWLSAAPDKVQKPTAWARFLAILTLPLRPFSWLVDTAPSAVAWLVSKITHSWLGRIAVVSLFVIVTGLGSMILKPELDYLPTGNRNIVFGLLFPPPGYNLEQLSEMGERIEERVRPNWEVTPNRFQVETVLEKRAGRSTDPVDDRVEVPMGYGQEGTVKPPPLDNYFIVSFAGQMFHGAVSADKKHVIDAIPMMNHATAAERVPDTIAFAFQAPLFRIGGVTGSAIKINLTGSDLDEVSGAAMAMFGSLMQDFGPYAIRSDPANFALPLEELQVVPRDERLRELGMTRLDLGLAVQANGDGILLFRDYEQNGKLKDMKIISKHANSEHPLEALMRVPVATPGGDVVDLASLADLQRVRGPEGIRHVDRLRAVTLELTPPKGMPLDLAIKQVESKVEDLRAAGVIPMNVGVSLSGSAGKLNEIKTALLGDGTFLSTISSTLVLAFLVIYFLLVVLFQSWTYPLVIMLSVPLATFGGLLGFTLVRHASLIDRYAPVQNLDMLSILGFVLLAGVVVNNAILIVHQALNFLRNDGGMHPQDAIVESVRSRVRPILMSTLTSVGGMLPLVLMPGAGSELYRGLGAVVVGGLIVSTVFTLFLVPAVLSILFAMKGTAQEAIV